MIGRTQVDGCDACGGLWFDADELLRVARGGREAVAGAEAAFEPPPQGAGMELAGMVCPRCEVPLYEFEFGHSAGIKLDACPQCKGIWVDDRELDAMAARMRPATPAREQAEPQQQRPAVRRRARRALNFMQRVECRKCGEENHAGALVCWVCGAPLQGKRGRLLCPRCDNPLFDTAADPSDLQLEVNPHVDHCCECGGIWLELAALSVLMDVPLEWLREWQARLDAAVAGDAVNASDETLCPVCQVPLHERSYARDESVYIDRCTECRGTWLDHGELIAVRQVSIQQDVWGNRP